MLTKLVALIVLGMTISLTSPNTPPEGISESTVAEALVQICLGPMSIAIGAPDTAFVNLSFDAFTHGEGHAGLVHGHIRAALNPFKTNPLSVEYVQTQPRRVSLLP